MKMLLTILFTVQLIVIKIAPFTKFASFLILSSSICKIMEKKLFMHLGYVISLFRIKFYLGFYLQLALLVKIFWYFFTIYL